MDYKTKIAMLHEREDALNKEMGEIDKQIRLLQRRKLKITRLISNNMLFRNKVINRQIEARREGQ